MHLSAKNPAFNPYNYQTGSVWPHDNGIIAMGFKRYGFSAEAAQIAHDVSKSASHFQLNQLPELFTAFPRDEMTFPVQYIGANVFELGRRIYFHAHAGDAGVAARCAA